jgi:hypothetical protein
VRMGRRADAAVFKTRSLPKVLERVLGIHGGCCEVFEIPE